MMEFIHGLKLRMKQTLISLFISTFLLMGCSKQETPIEPKQEEQKPQRSSEQEIEKAKEDLIKTNPALAPATNDLTPEQAKQAAQRTYDYALDEEKFITDAFKLKEFKTLEDYGLHPKDSLFPNDEMAFPYGRCEEMFGDVKGLAFSMQILLREDTAVNRKIYRDHQGNFERSKKECARLLKMPYNEVEKEYEDS